MTRTKCCYGLSMDLLDNIAMELGFEFHLYIVRDQMFGSKQRSNVKDFLHSKQSSSSDKKVSDGKNDGYKSSMDMAKQQQQQQQYQQQQQRTHTGNGQQKHNQKHFASAGDADGMLNTWAHCTKFDSNRHNANMLFCCGPTINWVSLLVSSPTKANYFQYLCEERVLCIVILETSPWSVFFRLSVGRADWMEENVTKVVLLWFLHEIMTYDVNEYA